MLLNMDGTIQSAGMYLVDCRQTLVPYLTWMAGAGARVEEFAAFNYPRICPMVSGACLATRRVTFLEMGGFDEGYYNGYEDADYCLRLGERGLLVVYQPGSVVRHHGSPNPPERFRCHRENRARFLARWQALVPAHAIRTADGQMRFTSGDHPRRYLGLGT
jgi:GT2 family glycosyltransferase